MQDDFIRLNELMDSAQKRLALQIGHEEARAVVRETVLRLKGWDGVALALHLGEYVSDFFAAKVDDVVSRVADGEPLQYVLGVANFYGMDFYVDPHVLIPRPETAQLVDMIVDENHSTDLRVLDVGTGSGCIAVALARHLRFAKVDAIDVSEAAVDVARKNSVALKAKVNFILADMLNCDIKDPYDIIVSNPPYVTYAEASSMEKNVLYHEPAGALFVPDDNPLLFYKAVLDIAGRSLSDVGKIYFEINPLYARSIIGECRLRGFNDVEVRKDMFGKNRFIVAER